MVTGSPNKRRDMISLGLGIFILVLVNFIGTYAFKRFDLTSEKRHTLSNASIEMVEELEDYVFIKVYLEGDLPESKAKRAVDLSITKYCSVAKILESTAKVTYSTYLNNKEI